MITRSKSAGQAAEQAASAAEKAVAKPVTKQFSSWKDVMNHFDKEIEESQVGYYERMKVAVPSWFPESAQGYAERMKAAKKQ